MHARSRPCAHARLCDLTTLAVFAACAHASFRLPSARRCKARSKRGRFDGSHSACNRVSAATTRELWRLFIGREYPADRHLRLTAPSATTPAMTTILPAFRLRQRRRRHFIARMPTTRRVSIQTLHSPGSSAWPLFYGRSLAMGPCVCHVHTRSGEAAELSPMTLCVSLRRSDSQDRDVEEAHCLENSIRSRKWPGAV